MDHVAPTVSVQRVWELLATIDDPEMPISIVDLGIVASVQAEGAGVRVCITPTFTGCPALNMIDDLIRSTLQAEPAIKKVEIQHVFDPPWSVERISEAGRDRLRQHGVTVPGRKYVQLNTARQQQVACPYCSSSETRLDSPFGPTRCRQIYYCENCRNAFEHMKAV